ncbi:MAG: YMGG-like glycine zipper-containing protein [Bryobacteraceae bacterium]
MKLKILGLAAFSLWLTACANSGGGASGPHATVMMRDGSRVTGTVTATSPSEITIAGDDKAAHTFAMKDVRRVDYDEPSPAGSAEEASHDAHDHPPQSAITTKTQELPVGTKISVRNEETIDSSKAAEGQIYAAEVTRDVTDSTGAVVIPRGSNAQVVIKSASSGGKIRGAADLVLDLNAVSVDGQEYDLSTVDIAQKGRDGVGKNSRTAKFTGGGAAVGAIIGAIAGGGKGAAIGAAAGAGAGATTQVLTKGQIKVPAETVMTFQLDRPLRVVAAK